MSGTVDLKIIFTGICTYVPGAVLSGSTFKEVRFIMPNARKWQKSLKKHGAYIPPHNAFFIAREAETAKNAAGAFLGRQPAGRLGDKWVYWPLEDENLRIDGAPTSGVTIPAMTNVADIPTLCYDSRIESRHFDKRTDEVGARFILEHGALKAINETDCKYRFHLPDNTYTTPAALVDEIAADVTGVKVGSSGEVKISSKSLDDSTEKGTPIILRAPRNRTIKTYCTNAPEADLLSVVGLAYPHPHGDANLHFELYYLLAGKKPGDIVPVPELVPGTCTGGPPLPGADTCPPSSNKP